MIKRLALVLFIFISIIVGPYLMSVLFPEFSGITIYDMLPGVKTSKIVIIMAHWFHGVLGLIIVVLAGFILVVLFIIFHSIINYIKYGKNS